MGSFTQTYSSAMDAGVAGQRASNGPSDVSHRNASVAINFGAFVCLAGGQAALPAVAGDVTGEGAEGFALRDLAMENGTTGGQPQYPAGRMVSVMRKGRIFASASVAVNDGDPVYVGYGAAAGNLSNTATANYALLPGARWVQTIAAAGVAALEVNLPQ